MRYAQIDYGDGGKAELWGDFEEADVEAFFMKHANQCFGIRKSIFQCEVLSTEERELPEPWNKLEGAAVVLKHNGDTIVWNAAGDKIKSEWD